MTTLTIENVPDELLVNLQVAAKRGHRSISQEVVMQLSKQDDAKYLSGGRKALLQEVEALRKKLPKFFSADEIDQVIQEGKNHKLL